MGVADFVYNKLVSKFNFDPTECQEKLLVALSEFITDPSSNIFVINGYAGTGKTTSMSALISVLKDLSKNYILLAPTGRAAKVLANYTGVSAKTIHKQIYRQKSLKY